VGTGPFEDTNMKEKHDPYILTITSHPHLFKPPTTPPKKNIIQHPPNPQPPQPLNPPKPIDPKNANQNTDFVPSVVAPHPHSFPFLAR